MPEILLPGEPRLCTDLHGRPIRNNERYTPGWDECTVCTCDNGEHKLCQSVMCAPPRACRQYQVGKKCCEFICLDGGGEAGPANGFGGGSRDLGLRLVASAVTAVLSLALLLFLVYRLRQRRHRGPPSLRPEEAYNMTLMTYLRGSGYLGGGGGGGGSSGGGCRGSHDFYYEEPPPPYSLWKPPQPAAGEAPPPYSEAVRLPALRPDRRYDGGRTHAVLVMTAPAEDGPSERDGELRRQQATVHRSELDPDLESDLDPDLAVDLDLDQDLDLDPPAGVEPAPGSPPRSTPGPDRDVERRSAAESEPELEPPERVLQRFSLQLQLDCSDSATSSSPTLTPDGARPVSSTSSSGSG